MNERIEHQIEAERWVCWDEKTQQIVGVLHYRPLNDGHWHVQHVAVEPQWQGLGLAKRLVLAIHQEAVQQHIKLSSSCSYATAVLARLS